MEEKQRARELGSGQPKKELVEQAPKQLKGSQDAWEVFDSGELLLA